MPNPTKQVKQVGCKASIHGCLVPFLTRGPASNDISIRSSGENVISVNYHNRNRYDEVLSRKLLKYLCLHNKNYLFLRIWYREAYCRRTSVCRKVWTSEQHLANLTHQHAKDSDI